MADRPLIEIFDDCVNRLQAGQSLEDILRQYPSYAGTLRPLLEITRGVQRMRIPQAEVAESQNRIRSEVLREYRAARNRRIYTFPPILNIAAVLVLTCLCMIGSGVGLISTGIIDLDDGGVHVATPSTQPTLTNSPTTTPTGTSTPTVSVTPSATLTASQTPTSSSTASPSASSTRTIMASLTSTATASRTRTVSPSPTRTATYSATPSPSATSIRRPSSPTSFPLQNPPPTQPDNSGSSNDNANSNDGNDNDDHGGGNNDNSNSNDNNSGHDDGDDDD